MLFVRPAVFCAVFVSAASAGAQEDLVRAQLDRFLDRWSQGPVIQPSDVNELYAPRVRYYGRELSRGGIMREKQSIARRWPRRQYRIVPSSIAYKCSADRERCSVTGVLRWSLQNDSGRRGSGASSLKLDLVRVGAGYQIVAESGAVLGRGRSAGSP